MKNETKSMFDYSFNICKFLGKKNGAAFAIKFILNSLMTKNDPFMSCPTIKKGSYRIDNFTLNGVDLPMTEYALNIRELEKNIYRFHIGHKTKVGKRFEDVATFDGFGHIIKV